MNSTEMTEGRYKILKTIELGPKKVKNIFWVVDSNWHTTKYHITKMINFGWIRKLPKATYEITLLGKKVLGEYK